MLNWRLVLFNLCILQAGPINKDLIQDYPSYDKMFSLLFRDKIHFWNVDVYNIYENNFPKHLNYYNAFIITGSAYGVYEDHYWIKNLFEVIKKIVHFKIPLLGICFGHQAIAQALGGHVIKYSKGWGIGIKEITTTKYKSILGNFQKLNLIFFHQDQVVKLPKNAKLLASNSFCTMASFSIDNSVLTLQAHPEFNKDFSLKLLEARKSNIKHKTYLEAVNELETLEHDGELIKPNIIDFLEQKFKK